MEGHAEVNQATNNEATPLSMPAQEGHGPAARPLVVEGHAEVNQATKFNDKAMPTSTPAQEGHEADSGEAADHFLRWRIGA